MRLTWRAGDFWAGERTEPGGRRERAPVGSFWKESMVEADCWEVLGALGFGGRPPRWERGGGRGGRFRCGRSSVEPERAEEAVVACELDLCWLFSYSEHKQQSDELEYTIS